MQLTLVFKSGALVTVDVSKFLIDRTKLGILDSVTWQADEACANALLHLNLDEVVAIIEDRTKMFEVLREGLTATELDAGQWLEELHDDLTVSGRAVMNHD